MKKINLKKILPAIGLLAVAVPAVLTVVACGTNKVKINKIALSTIITNNQIDGNKFNTESTVLNQIITLNNSVTSNDIAIKPGSFKAAEAGKDGSTTIVAKPTSKYTGEANITITALSSTNEQKVVNEINSANYTNLVVLNSEITKLKTTINAEFIKNKLTDAIVKIFEDSLFSLNKITNDNGIELTNKDLTTTGLIIAKINYNYGSIKNQNTELKIIIPGLPITDERENAIKDIIDARDALINNENKDEDVKLMYGYIGKVEDYFKIIINALNQNMFYFDANDLTNKNDEILKTNIINQLDLIIQSDLNRWNLDKLYNLSNSNFTSTLEINKTNQTIKITKAYASIMWINPKTRKDAGTFYLISFPESILLNLHSYLI